MNKLLSSYIDHNVIQEHAYRSRDGYSMWVDDLDQHEKDNLLRMMFAHDEVMVEMIEERMQDLINQRLPFVEARDNVNRGLRPVHDSQTGEVSWVKRVSNF